MLKRGGLRRDALQVRKFGARAALPGYIAMQLCPGLIIVKSRFAAYREASAKVQQVLAEYDPHFQAASLDEAYLDITDYLATRASQDEASEGLLRHRRSSRSGGENTTSTSLELCVLVK